MNGIKLGSALPNKHRPGFELFLPIGPGVMLSWHPDSCLHVVDPYSQNGLQLHVS